MIAGGGNGGTTGDNGNALGAVLNGPNRAVVDKYGNVYIADRGNQRIRKVDPGSNIITTIVGTGTSGYNGDGLIGTVTTLNSPYGIDYDLQGNVYIADTNNFRIRKWFTKTSLVSTIIGTGVNAYTGDGANATSAAIGLCYSIAVDISNNVYISDSSYHRVRFINGTTGLVVLLAGTGVKGFSSGEK